MNRQLRTRILVDPVTNKELGPADQAKSLTVIAQESGILQTPNCR